MAQGSAAAVAADNLGLCPAHGLLVDEFDGGQRLGLVPSVQCHHSPLPFSLQEIAHLCGHDRLLEPRARHGFLSRLLAGRPGAGPVGRLHAADALANLGILLQRVVCLSHRVDWCGIGGGDIGLGRPWGRVIRLHGILGQARDGGGIAPDEARTGRGSHSSESATAGHHGG